MKSPFESLVKDFVDLLRFALEILLIREGRSEKNLHEGILPSKTVHTREENVWLEE